MIILPVYDPSRDVWYIFNEDGSITTLTNEEYNKCKKFKTRYDEK